MSEKQVTYASITAAMTLHKEKLEALVDTFEKAQKASVSQVDTYMKKNVDTSAIDINKKLEDFKLACRAFNDAGKVMAAGTKEVSALMIDHANDVKNAKQPAYETIVTTITQHKEKLDVAVDTFEKAQKASVSQVDSYMKKNVDTSAIDPNKKLEDFKLACRAFNDAGKSMAKATKEVSVFVGDHATTTAAAANAPPPPPTATAAASAPPPAASSGSEPVAVPPLVKLQPSSNASSSLPATPRGPATPRDAAKPGENDASLNDALAKIAALDKSVEAQQAVINSQTADVTRLQEQIDGMRYAYAQNVDKMQLTEETYQAQISALELTAKERDNEIQSLQATLFGRESAIAHLMKERDVLRSQKAELIQRLLYADKSRENEFAAFEHSVKQHERDLHEWQVKYADAVSAAERMRMQAQALQVRLADDHLREHIRVLQKENNALREERIAKIHDSTKEPVALSQLTHALQENMAAVERDNSFLSERVKTLNADVADREKQVAEVLAQVLDEKRKSQVIIDALERKVRTLDFDVAMSAHDTQRMSRSLNLQPAVAEATEKVEKWDRGCQADDLGRRELERDVLSLRAQIAQHADELALRDQEQARLRSDLQDKLMHHAKKSDSQISDLQKDIKIRSFKLSKVQVHVEQLEFQLTHAQASLAGLRALPVPDDNAKFKSLEKQAASWQMLNEELLSKNKMLKRQLALRQDECDDQSRKANDAVRVIYNNATKSTSPSSSAPSSLRSRIQEMETVDAALLDLHRTSITLDNEAAETTNSLEETQKSLRQRIAYLESSLVFWGGPKSSGQVGPAGESRICMLDSCQKELADKQDELRASDAQAQNIFASIAQRREKILRETTGLMQRRSSCE